MLWCHLPYYGVIFHRPLYDGPCRMSKLTEWYLDHVAWRLYTLLMVLFALIHLIKQKLGIK